MTTKRTKRLEVGPRRDLDSAKTGGDEKETTGGIPGNLIDFVRKLGLCQEPVGARVEKRNDIFLVAHGDVRAVVIPGDVDIFSYCTCAMRLFACA